MKIADEIKDEIEGSTNSELIDPNILRKILMGIVERMEFLEDAARACRDRPWNDPAK